jgi:hypothetical protein
LMTDALRVDAAACCLRLVLLALKHQNV